MANYCRYKCIVRGPKNACYAVFGSMSCEDYKDIISESGSDENYELHFEGNCKWSVDSYCEARENPKPFILPESADDARAFGEANWYIPQYQKPILFGVEFLCNSADIDDYDPDLYDDCGGYFEHYAKDGSEVDDECPKNLYIEPDWMDDDTEVITLSELLEKAIQPDGDEYVELLLESGSILKSYDVEPFINDGTLESLFPLFERGLQIDKSEYDRLIEFASKYGKPEYTAWLLNRKNEDDQENDAIE